jgi:plasmid replication initiation protein
MSKLEKNEMITKTNDLISSSYSLSVEEQRLILASIEKSQRTKASLKGSVEVTLSAPEYAELYKVRMKAAYKALQESCDRLYERTIHKIEAGARVKHRWLQKQATYNNGKVTLLFSEFVSDHIRDFSTKQATQYSLIQATQLQVKHAAHVFELLHMHLDRETQEGEWDVSLDVFRDLLELPESYDRWSDLRNKVLEKIVDQINQNTSLKVEWHVSKKVGRNIDRICFTVFESGQLALGLHQS